MRDSLLQWEDSRKVPEPQEATQCLGFLEGLSMISNLPDAQVTHSEEEGPPQVAHTALHCLQTEPSRK